MAIAQVNLEGRDLAREHVFTLGQGKGLHQPQNAGADLLLVSGALHFFDPPVYHMVADLPEKPIHVLINRSPLIAGPTKAAVQDNNNPRPPQPGGIDCGLRGDRLRVDRQLASCGAGIQNHWEA